MPLALNVPYEYKDCAKNLEAFWNADHKIWTVPDDVKNLNSFKAWIPYTKGCIVRKPYLLCESKRQCWACGKETPMIALGAKNYYYYEDEGWTRGDVAVLLGHVLGIDQSILNYMQQHYRNYKKTYSRTAGYAYFGNTCSFCGKLQGDIPNYGEIDGAFFLTPFKSKPLHMKLWSINLAYDYHIHAVFGNIGWQEVTPNPTLTH